MGKKLMVAALVLLLAPPLVGLLVGPPWAAHLEGRASAAWQAVQLPLEGFVSRYPRSAPNGSARRLAELGAPLGLDFGSGLPQPAAAAHEALGALRSDLNRHVQALLAGQPSHAPELLRAFRQAHAPELAAVLNHLAEAPAPSWEQDVERDLEAPGPALMAHRDLAALTTLAALEPGPGDPAPEAALRALVRLGAGLRGRPQLITLIMSLTVDRRALALARRVEAAPPAAVEELARIDARGGLVAALQAEAWWSLHFAARDGRLEPFSKQGRNAWSAVGARLVAPFERTYSRLCAADLGRVMADLAGRTMRTPVCQPPTESIEQDRERLARWNVLGRMTLPGIRRVGRLTLLHALDVELTGKLLALRSQRAGGSWPERLADPGSRVCGGASWTYERRTDGSILLAYGGDLEPGEADDLRFEAR